MKRGSKNKSSLYFLLIYFAAASLIIFSAYNLIEANSLDSFILFFLLFNAGLLLATAGLVIKHLIKLHRKATKS